MVNNTYISSSLWAGCFLHWSTLAGVSRVWLWAALLAEVWSSTVVFKMDNLLLNFVRKCLFFSRQKVNCFNFCCCKFYYLCHKPISAQLWEFTLVTVKDLTFKAFLYNNTNKKNIGVIFVEAHQTNNILYKSSLSKS